MENIIHAFEHKGLGKAPFHFVDMHIRQNSEGRAAGTCQHCGANILFCCVIRSADGRTFEVGNQCVLKTDDNGLINPVELAVKAAQRRKTAERRQKKLAEFIGAARVKYERALPELRKHPHPKDYFAAAGKTLADYYEFCVSMTSNKGSIDQMLRAAHHADELANAEGR